MISVIVFCFVFNFPTDRASSIFFKNKFINVSIMIIIPGPEPHILF